MTTLEQLFWKPIGIELPEDGRKILVDSKSGVVEGVHSDADFRDWESDKPIESPTHWAYWPTGARYMA